MDREKSKSLKTVWLACWHYFDMCDVLAAPDPGIVYCFLAFVWPDLAQPGLSRPVKTPIKRENCWDCQLSARLVRKYSKGVSV